MANKPIQELIDLLPEDPRIAEAVEFAVEAHGEQKRKFNDTPFVIHPIRVARKAYQEIDNWTIDQIIVAILHDVLEDTDVPEEQMREKFGVYITDKVKELTNPSHGMKLPRAERKRIDREHIAKISNFSKEIKLLDRLDNIEELGEGAPDDFIDLYLDESEALLYVLLGTNRKLEKKLALQIGTARLMAIEKRYGVKEDEETN